MDTFLMLPDEGTQNHGDEMADLDAIESVVAPHGQALINLYFRIVHPSFPILHKRVFLEKYNRTHREFSHPLLAAVYILVLNWWSYSSDLASLPKPDVKELERLALKTINDVIHRPKLSTVQAGLLLLQRPEGDSWALTAQLVAIGQELGLHLDCSRWKIPDWERGLRKRLAWALFMQDKWGALTHGRPSHIVRSNWAVRPVVKEDFPENTADEDDEEGSTEVEKGMILFSQMISLTEILSEVLETFYTIKAIQEIENEDRDGTRLILEKAKPVQIKLKEWFARLPGCLRTDSTKIRKLSSTGKTPPPPSFYAVEDSWWHIRVPPSRVLCDRDYSSSPHRSLAQSKYHRSISLAHLPLGSKDAPHLRHGLCQSAETGAPSIILVFRLKSEFRAHRYVWQSSMGDSTGEGRSGVLQIAARRVQMDFESQQQGSRVHGVRGWHVGCLNRPTSGPGRQRTAFLGGRRDQAGLREWRTRSRSSSKSRTGGQL